MVSGRSSTKHKNCPRPRIAKCILELVQIWFSIHTIHYKNARPLVHHILWKSAWMQQRHRHRAHPGFLPIIAWGRLLLKQSQHFICSVCSTVTVMGSMLIYSASSSSQDQESCLPSLREHPPKDWEKGQRRVVSCNSLFIGEHGSSPSGRSKHLENPIIPAPLITPFGSKGFITRISRFLALPSRNDSQRIFL